MNINEQMKDFEKFYKNSKRFIHKPKIFLFWIYLWYEFISCNLFVVLYVENNFVASPLASPSLLGTNKPEWGAWTTCGADGNRFRYRNCKNPNPNSCERGQAACMFVSYFYFLSCNNSKFHEQKIVRNERVSKFFKFFDWNSSNFTWITWQLIKLMNNLKI